MNWVRLIKSTESESGLTPYLKSLIKTVTFISKHTGLDQPLLPAGMPKCKLFFCL